MIKKRARQPWDEPGHDRKGGPGRDSNQGESALEHDRADSNRAQVYVFIVMTRLVRANATTYRRTATNPPTDIAPRGIHNAHPSAVTVETKPAAASTYNPAWKLPVASFV
jgi:hypothetical protein